MRKKILVFLVPLVVLLVGSFIFPARFLHSANAEAQLQPMHIGNLSPLLKVSHLQSAYRSNQTLQMSVGLALRNQSQLSALLQSLYDPSSPNYRQFLTPGEFAQQFGPSAGQRQAVINYLVRQGFTITQTYTGLVDFSGPVSLAERVFGVTINNYLSPDGRVFYANTTQPTLPAYLAAGITSISGLDDANLFSHPPIPAHNAPALRGNAASNCPAPGQGGGGGGILGGGSQVAYIPSQFSTAYNYDSLHRAGLHGEGQTAGVFELDGYSQSDVQAYTQCFGGGTVPIQNVLLDGFNGQPGAGAVEVELDMEVILSVDPHLAKLIVYEAPNTTQGYNDEFARIVKDRTPVISVSWGDCEQNMGQQEANQENQFFQQAAAQGQSILVAAGDSGSASCFQLQGGGFNTSLNADDPASQPYVTGVGGTNLTLNANNSYQTETVWNGGFLGGAGGGGISQFWKRPSWQTGPGVSNPQYSNNMRETPDVSLDADPATGYPVYCTAGSSCSGGGGIPGGSSGGWITVGGTSAAAPMWAAMIVLANEQAAKAHKGHVGFLNPALYRIASGSHYGSDFHDITPPSNSSSPSNNDEGFNGGAYPVTNGYDMATGWGSFNAARLAADLA
ncbi:MAG TPA: S53 family peptidase [Ktedonobacteraceae bacterium]|nr:S53 family peptidase [Ktedonobacteraceae bacterium]